MSAVQFAQDVETRRMLDSVSKKLEEEMLGNGYLTTETYQIILTWVYTSHEKSFKKALCALGAIEKATSTVDYSKLHYKYAITFVRKFVAHWIECKTEIMQIVFMEDDNASDDSCVICTFESDRQLKYYVKHYADKRGIPLRSLRFSYAGKTLLLTSVGHLPPKELGMRDNDVIMVHDENKPREASDSINDSENMVNSSNRKTYHMKTKTNHQAKTKPKLKKNPNLNYPPMASEDYKAQHFEILSKLHEEMQPRLREIRMTLNTLKIECQSPKSRTKKKEKSMEEDANHKFVAETGIGGKAGEPCFVVQVGEEQHLYKTAKAFARTLQNSPRSPRNVPALDLHGCTRDEAVVKLNESLKVWVETAMKGSYPFVITAEIVCGCGSQVPSEMVQTWIQSSNQVRNAPKNT